MISDRLYRQGYLIVKALLLTFFFCFPATAENLPILTNLTYTAGQQRLNLIADQQLRQELTVKLERQGEPLAGEKVYFSLVTSPPHTDEAAVIQTTVLTGVDGIARTPFTPGTMTGEYRVAAFVPEARCSPVVFTISVSSQYWLIFIGFSLLGGLAVFLFGMFYMSDNLQQMGGGKLEGILAKCTSNRIYGVLVGTLITAIIQSSSATTVMAVGLINSGMMSFVQAIGIILGANIGTTITAQIVAFKLTDYALLFIALGFFFKVLAKQRRKKLFGNIFLGFGFLFFGIKIMTDATLPLRTYQPFIDLLIDLENPFIGVLVGAAFTAIIRSSSAATGVYIALAFQGLLTLESAIPLILGANIGTSTNAVLASLGANREAKRAALAHVLFNMSKVAVFLPLLSYYRDLVYMISPHPSGIDVLTTAEQIAMYAPRQIANGHSLAKIIAVIVWLPFTPFLAKLCMWIFPTQENEKQVQPKYLDENLLKYPSMALAVTRREVLRMADYVRDLFDQVLVVFENRDERLLRELIEEDKKIDILYQAIRPYLSKIGQGELGEEQSRVEMEIVLVAEMLENFGDIISKSLLPSTFAKIFEHDLEFSVLDKEHILDFHRRNRENLANAMGAFANNDLVLAGEVLDAGEEIEMYYKALNLAHLQKYRAGVEKTIRASTLYSSILANFKQLHFLSTQIAQAVIEAREEEH